MAIESGVKGDDGSELVTASREARQLSKQLARILASPWRAWIWTELGQRPMSPSQFSREIGGDQRYMRRCFRQLEEWGFIELAEVRHQRGRRGRAERVYRSTRRAFISNDVAAHLPLPVREHISANVLSNYFRHLAHAIEAGSFASDADRHLSCDSVILRGPRWIDLTAYLLGTLEWLPELALEVAERTAGSGRKPVPITVGILGFRSPKANQRCGALEVSSDDSTSSGSISRDPPAPFLTSEFAKALGDPWRARILAETTTRAVSPSTFVKEYGGELTHIGRCFRQLADAGCIELVRERRGGRGAGPAGVEHLYRSVRQSRLPAKIWAIPGMLDDRDTAKEMKTYLGSVADAMTGGTFDADIDRHLSWDVVALDPQGWKELMARLADLRRRATTLAAEPKEPDKEAEAASELISTTVGLAAFRSPPPFALPDGTDL